MKNYFVFFAVWILLAVIAYAAYMADIVEEDDKKRKAQARNRARREAHESARRLAELKRQIELREAEIALHEANRAFYKTVNARRVIFDSVKTDPEGNLISAKGRVA